MAPLGHHIPLKPTRKCTKWVRYFVKNDLATVVKKFVTETIWVTKIQHGYTYPRNVSLNSTTKYDKEVRYFIKNDLARGVEKFFMSTIWVTKICHAYT